MPIQIADLKSQNNKAKYLLGSLIYGLYKAESVRLLYAPEATEQQKSIKKIFNLLKIIDEQIDAIRQAKFGQKDVVPEVESHVLVVSQEEPVESPKTEPVLESLKTEQMEESGQGQEEDIKERYIADLNNTDSSVKTAAIKVLSKLLRKDVVPLIVPMLDDADPYVRGMAVTCLGLHGGDEGLAVIVKLKDDTDVYVQKCFKELTELVPQSSVDVKVDKIKTKSKISRISQKENLKKTTGRKKRDGKKDS
ncbi:MAG: HEAT repeat domain-containing protein [Candidatus Omnitrophica bacterium]|nr:HEAT repeat domain-containing protein [Candidatus Omnitrophota bacterium]